MTRTRRTISESRFRRACERDPHDAFFRLAYEWAPSFDADRIFELAAPYLSEFGTNVAAATALVTYPSPRGDEALAQLPADVHPRVRQIVKEYFARRVSGDERARAAGRETTRPTASAAAQPISPDVGSSSAAVDTTDSSADDSDIAAAIRAHWAAHQIDRARAIEIWHALGIEPPAATGAPNDAFEVGFPPRSATPENPLDLIAWLADRSQRCAAIDVEASTSPPDYAFFLDELERASAGRFEARAVSQTARPRTVRVQFECGCVHRFTARLDDDWYDVRATLAAVNRALASVACPERFVELPTDDQVARLLFVEPRRYRGVARALFPAARPR
ncbi:MAG: hypothetical protein KC609_16695 [Myxococcales bacterium]|nr:hypothetical protein [Myxococcales bacterium]